MPIYDRRFGDIEFSGKDFLTPSIDFDRIAVTAQGKLLLLSVIADQMRIKQIRAILGSGVKCSITAGGIRVGKPGAQYWDTYSPGRLFPDNEGYATYTHKLGYGMVHAMFVTRDDGFLPIVTEESLWQKLKGTKFTTPLIREWVPYITERLRADERLEDADCYNCECGVLSATDKSLDEVITEGLQQYLLSIPR